jgi:hypothetical protein
MVVGTYVYLNGRVHKEKRKRKREGTRPAQNLKTLRLAVIVGLLAVADLRLVSRASTLTFTHPTLTFQHQISIDLIDVTADVRIVTNSIMSF